MKPTPRIYVGAGALVHKGGRLLMVRRNEPPSKGMWSFPGGAVELGETTRDTAVREIREETGLNISIEGLFDVVTYLPVERGSGAKNQVVVVDYLAKPKRGRVKLNHESSEFGWFTPSQIQKMNTTSKLKECAAKFGRMNVS